MVPVPADVNVEAVAAARDAGKKLGEKHYLEIRYEDLHADELAAKLRRGDFYELLPPDGDIHKVETVSQEPSISLHLLGSDIGCTWRHRYEPEHATVHDFRSSYSNEPCEGDGAPKATR